MPIQRQVTRPRPPIEPRSREANEGARSTFAVVLYVFFSSIICLVILAFLLIAT